VVDKEEVITRTLQLHEGLGHGDVVEVLDTWCDSSYPGSILASKAFTQVNSLTRTLTASTRGGALTQASLAPGVCPGAAGRGA
jgi:hypothetical protein